MFVKVPNLLIASLFLSLLAVSGDSLADTDKFRQLEEILPTPDELRLGSGRPGPAYWQQRADYKIDVSLDDAKQRILGEETITYHNRSPHTLDYLWLQLDQNVFEKNSDANLAEPAPGFDETSFKHMKGLLAAQTFEGGYKIKFVKDESGKGMAFTIVKTMMRVDLTAPLKPGATVKLQIKWEHNINDATKIWGRTGYEYFKEDNNYIYEIAHWFPRMVAYTDVNGWQNKQFLGSGEFTLEFGDYEVNITAPASHVVTATGELTNGKDVLTAAQQERFKKARTAKAPVFVVTPEEAKANEKVKDKGKTKTWSFAAKNVRDFAFASSRKFIWDALLHKMNGQEVMAMSLYPNEAEPLWSKYSTHAIVHTLNVYSRYTFEYPYPVAISVNGPVGGMEYPMICFNGPRPMEDKTYFAKRGEKGKNWRHSKYGLISVIIHEVGHNYFPMIVNSDERQWTWMDEGLNSFLQFLAEVEWEKKYPTRRGPARNITSYMQSKHQVPIMTNSESILQFGNNAYGKPATALNILRETILGRELFDFAFKQYAQQWMFKRPMPADFFRIMEDASGIDLDWFWRGWFYTTDHVDIALGDIQLFEMDTLNPYYDKARRRKDKNDEPADITETRTQTGKLLVDRVESLKDFYNSFDEFDVTPQDVEDFKKALEDLDDDDKAVLNVATNFYVIELKNLGGLVMPVIMQINYERGRRETMTLPAEIWRYNSKRVHKLLVRDRKIESIVIDPNWETADVNVENNRFPPRFVKSRFKLFKTKHDDSPMKKAKDAKDKKNGDKDGDKKK